LGYRVYDIERNQWIKDNVYLNPDGDLFLIKKSIFGRTKKPILLESDRYVYHNDIGLFDKNENLIYIGDYVRAQVEENRFVIGVVNCAIDPAAYAILREDIEECFILGSEVCQFVEIIGNVFDGYEVDIEETEEDSEEVEVNE
jgi:hypothetical protein